MPTPSTTSITLDINSYGLTTVTFQLQSTDGINYTVTGVTGTTTDVTSGDNSLVLMTSGTYDNSSGPFGDNHPVTNDNIFNATLPSTDYLDQTNLVAFQSVDGSYQYGVSYLYVTDPFMGDQALNYVSTNFNGYSSIAPTSGLSAFCFTPNTLISTPTGSTPVQDLHIGDLILNHAGESVPVKWIGRQCIHPAFAGDSLPICIRQGALGNDLPLRDLYVSPGHAMYIDDCLLIDAKALINGTTITQVTQWEGDIEYFHIETQNHEIILAEGTPAETFMDNVSRACFNNYSEYQALYPDAPEMIELDIPRISHQRQLPNTIKHKLEAVAEVLMGEGNGVKEQMVG